MAFTLLCGEFGNVVNRAFLVLIFWAKTAAGATFFAFCNYVHDQRSTGPVTTSWRETPLGGAGIQVKVSLRKIKGTKLMLLNICLKKMHQNIFCASQVCKNRQTFFFSWKETFWFSF